MFGIGGVHLLIERGEGIGFVPACDRANPTPGPLSVVAVIACTKDQAENVNDSWETVSAHEKQE